MATTAPSLLARFADAMGALRIRRLPPRTARGYGSMQSPRGLPTGHLGNGCYRHLRGPTETEQYKVQP